MKSEFGAMEFDPTIRQAELVWKVHSRLAKNKFFSERLPQAMSVRFGFDTEKEAANPAEAAQLASKLIRFVILIVDEESPLASERDWAIRLREAAAILKIPTKNNRMWDMISAEDPAFVECMQEYISYIHSYDYKNWVALLKHHDSMTKFLLSTPTFGGKNAENDMVQRLNTEKNLEGTVERLQALEAKLFPTPRIERKIKEKLLDDSFAGYVEQFANKYKEEDVI